jgi:predicted RNase H-like HicB family nuclease
MENKNYSFRIAWSNEDEGFVATCPELPGLSAFGETENQALKEAKVAKELFIKDMVESGELLPEPQTAQTYSGQTRLRLPKSLHQLAAEMAQQEDVSLNQYIVDAVRTRVTSEQVGRPILQEMRRYLQETRLTVASAVMAQQTVTPVETVKTTKEVSERTLLLVTPGESRKAN